MKRKVLRTRDHIKDSYYILMNMSWIKLILLIIAFYLLINLFFSLIYFFGQFSVSNLSKDSFVDYFFFSVQTLSTIGYGYFTPADIGSNILVTAQAVVGMTFVATITGVTFAKFSRPISHIVFSDKAVIANMDGKDFLSFRVGNKRENDIVDASIKVTGLFYHTTSEGHKIRKMIDLDLTRERSAFFALSWVVYHPLENSPFTLENLLGISVLVTGHDGTYSQTIYSRKMYYPDDIHLNSQFADVIYEDENNVTRVDFEKFHDLK